MICDSQDDDRDGDGVGNNNDDFPDDRSATTDTDGDGDPDSIIGVSQTGLVEDYDDDNDNWNDGDELECGTDPLDENDFPTDSDQDGTCDALEDDTDGDGVIDIEDAFPDDSSEWLDTDGDEIGNNADEDDDGDQWSDEDEVKCGSDPLDENSIPENIEEDGTCVITKVESNDTDDDSSSSTMWWICVCLPLLLLLLLIPLMYVARERGDSLLVMVGMINGPEPENTTSRPDFVSGAGTKNDPFVLKPAHVKNFGDSVTSKETITISKLDPDSLITITDLAASNNRGRFNMDSIIVEGDTDETETGSVVFQLEFDDNVTEDDVSGVYTGQIRVGSASVYLLWEVTVGDPESEEEAEAKQKAEEEAAEKEAKKEAAAAEKLRKAEEKAAAAEAKAKAAEEKAASEKKARENAEDAARAAAEQAAKERLEQMDKEMEERRKKLEQMDEATRKKEEELLRISEKAKTIDFATLGVATSDEKDDLQKIKGVGPFIEDKLNALGIYTFEQVGNMTSKIEEQVNIAIEFFPGRIKRDKWANQARKFAKEK